MEQLKVIMDFGHNGRNIDSGAVGKNGVLESDVVFKIGQAATEKFKYNGVDVVLTRQKEIQKLSLTERCEIANKSKGDYFISLHYNAIGSRTTTGTEVVIYRDSLKDAKALGTKVVNDLSAALGSKNRGVIDCVKLGRELTVLKHTDMTAILIEVDFLSNEEVEKKTKDAKYIDLVATTIVKSVLEYAKRPYKEPGKENAIHRVVLGAFTVEQNAKFLLDEVKKKGYKDAYILKEIKK